MKLNTALPDAYNLTAWIFRYIVFFLYLLLSKMYALLSLFPKYFFFPSQTVTTSQLCHPYKGPVITHVVSVNTHTYTHTHYYYHYLRLSLFNVVYHF